MQPLKCSLEKQLANSPDTGLQPVAATMQVYPPAKNAIQSCQLERVRTWLGLEEGGGEALRVLAFLVGGDYHTGAERGGSRSALAAIMHLLKGHKVPIFLDISALSKGQQEF